MEATPSAQEVAAAAAAAIEEDGRPLPGSPSFSIPAVKTASRRPTFDVQAWPARAAATAARRSSSGGSSTGGDSASTEPLELQLQPAWRRAWTSVAAAAGAFVRVAARALPSPAAARTKELLTMRSHSLDVLYIGREQSAPYLPTKRSMQHCGSRLEQQLAAGDAAGAALPSGRALAVLRWRRACLAVIDAQEVLRCQDLLSNRLAPPDDRLHAAIVLRLRLEAYPRPEKLAWALLAQRGASRVRCADHLMNELYITGERIFSFFVPPPMGKHRPYVTLTLLAVLVLLYFFMAGQYGQYQALAAPFTTACMAGLRRDGTAATWGPESMVRWIAPRQEAWCYGGSPGKFDATFLIDWGARWAPQMRSSPQRWLTSALLHQSFVHLMPNCAMMAGLAGQVEMKHGSWRIFLVLLLSALGGNLLSAVTEAPCIAVVGASGMVFGAAGATVADTVHNFETLSRPLLRTIVLASFMIFFAVTVGTTATGTSHMSHVGGFLAGCLAALVLLRNPHRSKAEVVWTVVGVAGCVAFFVSLPCIFYLRQLPHVCCGC